MPKHQILTIKNNLLALDNEILALKEVILRQNKVILQLSEEILKVSSELKDSKKSPIQPISTGNEGVNQSINHLINQSLINQSLNHTPLSTDLEYSSELEDLPFTVEKPLEKEPVEDKKPEKQLDLGTITSKKPIDQEISFFKNNLNRLFSSLSKQELKVFLSLYQLDEETTNISYLDLAAKLSLSEPCIRGYISCLIRKGLPIIRKKLNNRRTILTLSKDFKSLSLKQKLISLYYESDPKQTTLFDKI